MVPSFRQLLAVCFSWALAAWISATMLALKAGDRSLVEALSWYYAVRAPFVGASIAGIVAPFLCLDLGAWASGRFPRRAAMMQALVRSLQGMIGGMLIGLLGTFCILFIWPNDMQSQRMDAVKWTAFYWSTHPGIMVTAALSSGILSTWLARWLEEPAGETFD